MVDEAAKWFEGVWAQREEVLYREFFGDIGEKIHTIPETLFQKIGVQDIDPRWLTHGVFESKPNHRRGHWLYVTSALSNPWGESPKTANAAGMSGLGFEFTMETPGPAAWAIATLQWLMAMQILVATGLLDGGLVEYNDLVPLGAPIDGAYSGIRHLVLTEPAGYPKRFALASGLVDFMLCVGVTEREREFAKSQGIGNIMPLLKHHGVYPLTDAVRRSFI